ncbi:PIR protein [Plasmodium sp. DRC-Itaito]|nr:PIR protein [Plasmodium sp. DRC-Itaito]
MNLHCSKILLLFLPLSILVTSYQEHNTNKPSIITPNHTQTNRSLCECETQSSNYDKDTGMKSVMQQFVDRTSQRFQEYQERMKDKRQKRKEERDKRIQEIIEEDNREKSLVEKVEKGCLKCGCALGGVAASVGVFGGLGVYGSEMAASAVAAKAGGIKKGIEVGLERVIAIAKDFFGCPEREIPAIEVLQKITAGKFTDEVTLRAIFKCISSDVESQLRGTHELFFEAVDNAAKTTPTGFNEMYYVPVEAVEKAVEEGKATAIAAEHAKYTPLYSAIGYSVLAILIIVLVMIIIYLVLRYRRKKKMEKKAQYTKLLNQ